MNHKIEAIVISQTDDPQDIECILTRDLCLIQEHRLEGSP